MNLLIKTNDERPDFFIHHKALYTLNETAVEVVELKDDQKY